MKIEERDYRLMPSVGTHEYTIEANIPDVGASEPVALPVITIHALSGIALAESQIELTVGEEYAVRATAQYGPVSIDITSMLQLSVKHDRNMEFEGNKLRPTKPGMEKVAVSYLGVEAELRVLAKPQSK